jgi:hypothetical protein
MGHNRNDFVRYCRNIYYFTVYQIHLGIWHHFVGYLTTLSVSRASSIGWWDD